MNKEYQQFADELNNFLDGSLRTAAVRGVNDTDKLRMTLLVLNNRDTELKGTIMTSSVTRLRELAAEAFGENTLTAKMGEPQRLGNMVVSAEKYTGLGNLGYDDADFALYYPVETVLIDPKKTENLREHLKSSRADKIIIVTTNDFHGYLERIRPLIDVDVVLDTSKTHPDQYQTVIRNLARENQKLDY